MKINAIAIIGILSCTVHAQETPQVNVESSIAEEQKNENVVDAPELSPEVLENIEKLKLEGIPQKAAATDSETTAKDDDSLKINAVYDEILSSSGELKALGVTSVAQLSPDVYSRVVSELLKKMTPPELIKLTRRLQESKRRAEAEPLRRVKSLSLNYLLDVDGSKEIKEVKLMPGYSTTIEFYDTAGNPWPIVDQSIGNDIFTVTRPALAPHTLRITVKEDFKQTNMTYLLDGLSTSFRFMLSATDDGASATSERLYHDRVSLTVPLVSKAMKDGVTTGLKLNAVPTRNSSLNMFLELSEYESPEGSIIVPVINGDAQVWLYDGAMYVRTRYKSLMFPESKQQATSGSGIKVFRVDDIRPILVFSHEGDEKFVQLDDDVIIQSTMMNNQNELLETRRNKQRGKDSKEGKSGYYSAK